MNKSVIEYVPSFMRFQLLQFWDAMVERGNISNRFPLMHIFSFSF